VTISVVVPCFNGLPYIRQAIEPLLSSSAGKIEVIVQDGGSTDGTLEYLTGLGSKVSVISEPDEGQTQALNKGLERATGEVIGWLNADDEYDPAMLATVQVLFQENSSIDVIYGDYLVINANGEEVKRYRAGMWSRKTFLWHGMAVFTGSLFFRKSVFDRFGTFDESLNFCMDLEYCLRISDKTDALYVPRVLGKFRIHPRSKTGTGALKFVVEAHRLRWSYSGTSLLSKTRVSVLTAKELLYASTRGIWMSRTWLRIKPYRQL
jgi:glycosyltransferase involved in cell wall biosynthesis